MNSTDVEVRPAGDEDLEFVGQDRYIPDDVLQRKVHDGEVLIATLGPERVGYLRLEYLWSRVPYIALVRVTERYQRRGVGRALLAAAEHRLRSRGFDALYSSSQADEPEPQAWHRHMGFDECGVIAGINQGGVGELFFRKRL